MEGVYSAAERVVGRDMIGIAAGVRAEEGREKTWKRCGML